MSDSRTRSTASQENSARDAVTALLAQAETKRENFMKLLPSTISWETFKDTFKIAVQTRPSLLDADRNSLWIALQKAAMDGLMPDSREGALVIFNEDVDEDGNPVSAKGTKQKSVVWMPMIRGIIRLARNTGDVAGVRAVLIYEGETFTMSDVDGAQSYHHERRMGLDFDDSDAKIVGAYAVINFKDGTWDMEPMSRRQIERVKAVSRARSAKSPWQTWFSEMAKKTVLRRLLKRQDSSSVARMEAALDRDEGLTIEHDETPAPQGRIAQQTTIDPLAGLNKGPKQPVTTQDEDPASASLGTKAPTTSQSSTQGQQETKKPAPQQEGQGTQQTAPTTQQQQEPAPFEHYATDEIFEVAGDGEMFTTPRAFAIWFEEAAAVTTNIVALVDNNADPIAECQADPEAAAMITTATNKAKARMASGASKEEAKPEEAEPETADAPSLIMAIPRTPGGKFDGPKYAAAAKAEIAKLDSLGAVDGWEAANAPSYAGSAATKLGVDKVLEARRVVLGADPAAAVDRLLEQDERAAQDMLVEIAKRTTAAELDRWNSGTITVTLKNRWKDDPTRRHLYDMVGEAFQAATAEIEARRRPV